MSLNPFFSVESGALLLDHSYSLTSGATTTSVSYSYLDIPLLLRFSPIGLISVDGGVYYGVPLSIVSAPTEMLSAPNPR